MTGVMLVAIMLATRDRIASGRVSLSHLISVQVPIKAKDTPPSLKLCGE